MPKQRNRAMKADDLLRGSGRRKVGTPLPSTTVPGTPTGPRGQSVEAGLQASALRGASAKSSSRRTGGFITFSSWGTVIGSGALSKNRTASPKAPRRGRT